MNKEEKELASILAWLRLAIYAKALRMHWSAWDNFNQEYKPKGLIVPDLLFPFPVYPEIDIETLQETKEGYSPFIAIRAIKGHDIFRSICWEFGVNPLKKSKDLKIIHQLIYRALGSEALK